MIGYGSYVGNGHGGGGSSNLSALAPPFTVERSGPQPAASQLIDSLSPPFTVDRSQPKPSVSQLVDLGEPLNWIDTNPYTFSSAQPSQLPSYDQNSDIFEPKTYYPSYVQPPLHVSTFNEESLSGTGLDHTAQWGGGLWDWEKGKPAQLGGSFYPEEMNVPPSSIYTDHNNMGAHSSKSLKTCEETSLGIYSLGSEKQVVPPSIEKLDYNPLPGQKISFWPINYSKTFIGSSSALPETNLQVPALNLGSSLNCQNNQVPFISPYEKPVRQHGSAPTDTVPTMKSSPGIVIIPPAVNSCFSASDTVPFKNASTEINGTDTNLIGTNLSNVKEPYYLLNFVNKNEFDPSHLSFHLDGNCTLSGEALSTKTEKPSTTNVASKDASDNLFTAKSGVIFSHFNPYDFSSPLDNSEPVIAVENSLESLDHCNPSVDSPCWKGAPASHNSQFGSSEYVPVQLVKKLEAFDVSNGAGLKYFPMHTADIGKLPLGKSGEFFMTEENGNLKDGSVCSLKLPSVSVQSFTEHQSDDAGRSGYIDRKISPVSEIKFSDYASEQKKEYVLFDCSMNDVEKGSFSIQKSLAEEGRLASKSLRMSETGVADLEMKTNDVSSGCGSSHMSSHAVKNLSCSSSSVEEVSAKHSKFLGKKPPADSSITILVDTMHNLSELLLYNCCNEACELKEQDRKSLEKIINNLDTCMSKIIGQKSSLSELHEGTSMGSSQVEAIDVPNQHVQEKRKHSCKKDEKSSDFFSVKGVTDQHEQEKRKHSGKKDENSSDFFSVKSGTDIKVKNDEITQAIKNVLMENFHEEDAHPQALLYKNLWLEAEAALCSVNYMARFDKMKAEIEKCKLDSGKDLLEDTPAEDKMSRSEFSAEVNADRKLTAVAESGRTPAASNQNSPRKSSSNHADDVTARSNILKHRVINSNSVHGGHGDELFSSKLCLDLGEIAKLPTDVMDGSIPGMPSQYSPIPETDCDTDNVEASVLARFHILKSRGLNDLDSNEMESELLPDVSVLGFAGSVEQLPLGKDTAEDPIPGGNMDSLLQHQVDNHGGERFVVKDFHPCIMPDSKTLSPGSSSRLGNQLSEGWYDNCSSDWEHVIKEEFSGENS